MKPSPTPDPLRDLTEGESSLLDLARLSSRIRGRWSYRAVVVLMFVLVFATALWSRASVLEIADQSRNVANVTFQYAATILGIVIAGFAIFSTVATSDAVKPLARIQRAQTGTSELKHLALHFVAAFIPYLLFIGIEALVIGFGWHGGPVTRLAKSLGSEPSRYFASGFLAFFAAWLVHLLIVLQSFVFNVYKAFMTIARARLELEERLDFCSEESNPAIEALPEEVGGSSAPVQTPSAAVERGGRR